MPWTKDSFSNSAMPSGDKSWESLATLESFLSRTIFCSDGSSYLLILGAKERRGHQVKAKQGKNERRSLVWGTGCLWPHLEGAQNLFCTNTIRNNGTMVGKISHERGVFFSWKFARLYSDNVALAFYEL